MKEKLKTPPVLSFPDLDSLFVLETNASSTSLGMLLSKKKGDGKLHPAQFAFRKLTEQERRYTTSERKALALLFALKNFRAYLSFVYEPSNLAEAIQEEGYTRMVGEMNGFDGRVRLQN